MSHPPIDAPSEAEIAQAHKTLFAAGLTMRNRVAGEAYVEAALHAAEQNPHFLQPMQDYVTAACWGSVWTRPGLSLKARSLLNVAMLCCLNRSTELGVHVRGAVRNGASEVEIREAILQASVYSGMPAGIEGTKVAEKIIQEMKQKGEGPPAEGGGGE